MMSANLANLSHRELLRGTGNEGLIVAIRDRMRDSAGRFLQADETIQALVIGLADSYWRASLMTGFGAGRFVKWRTFAVTDRRILVFQTDLKRATVLRVLTELPRATRLGPATGLSHVIPAGAEPVRVFRRFFKDIAAADGYLSPVTS